MSAAPAFLPWLSARSESLKVLMRSRLANGSGLILLLLDERGACSPTELLSCSQLSNRAFWSSLHALREQGLVNRVQVGRKRRVYSITEQGRRMIS